MKYDFKFKKRKEFEDQIKKNVGLVGNWLKYAQWEASQGEFARARSVYERGLDVAHRNTTLWLKCVRTLAPSWARTPIPQGGKRPGAGESAPLTSACGRRRAAGTRSSRCAIGTSTRRATCGIARSL